MHNTNFSRVFRMKEKIAKNLSFFLKKEAAPKTWFRQRYILCKSNKFSLIRNKVCILLPLWQPSYYSKIVKKVFIFFVKLHDSDVSHCIYMSTNWLIFPKSSHSFLFFLEKKYKNIYDTSHNATVTPFVTATIFHIPTQSPFQCKQLKWYTPRYCSQNNSEVLTKIAFSGWDIFYSMIHQKKFV